MSEKMLRGFAAFGSGLSMLVSIGTGLGIGTATAFAVEGIARQPEAVDKILRVLWIGYKQALIPFIIAFVFALCLVFIANKCHSKTSCDLSIGDENFFIRAMASVSTGIAVLAGIGASLGIGEATSFAVEGIARQPEVVDTIGEVLFAGNLVALIPVIGATIIALLLLLIAKRAKKN